MNEIKYKFIIDENVIYCDLQLTDQQGKQDKTCLSLLHEIVKRCHQIVSDNKLKLKYYEIVERFRKLPAASQPIDFFKHLLTNLAKFQIEYGGLPKPSKGEETHPKDEFLVPIAEYFQGIIVTYDTGHFKNIEVKTPQEVLSLINV